MGINSNIEWTDHTLNLWWGCQKVSPGCDNCYAEVLSNRFTDVWGPDKPRKLIYSWKKSLMAMQRKAAKDSRPHRVFVGSMMDIFEKPKRMIDNNGNELDADTHDVRIEFFRMVRDCPDLIFLMLTKRPGNIAKYVPTDWYADCPSNVFFGTSVVDQSEMGKAVILIQATPGTGNTFLSIEPMLGEITLTHSNGSHYYEVLDGRYVGINHNIDLYGEGMKGRIKWVIVGGESGPKARPMNSRWVESIRDQCKSTDVPFFFKQWGEWVNELHSAAMPRLDYEETDVFVRWDNDGIDYRGLYHCRVGKKKAGRLLNGFEYSELPEQFKNINNE